MWPFFAGHIDLIPKVIRDLIIVSRNLPILFARERNIEFIILIIERLAISSSKFKK